MSGGFGDIGDDADGPLREEIGFSIAGPPVYESDKSRESAWDVWGMCSVRGVRGGVRRDVCGEGECMRC